jgi:D-alanyl-D-alanine carboxypeptidase
MRSKANCLKESAIHSYSNIDNYPSKNQCRLLETMVIAARAIPFTLTLLFILAITSTGLAQEEEPPFIVIGQSSGNVFQDNRAFERWYPASLTKLMTFYVTLRAINAGEIQEGSPVVMSRQATRQPPSKMGYAAGTRMRIDTALQILVVKSANDVAIALAEAVGGTVENFVARMNREATRLGMVDSRFANPHGLHSAAQYVTARDMALLARAILVEFPQYADYFAAPAIRQGENVHYSYNLLLERFEGADGMKTGFVCASGYNMVASATREGRRLIAVVLGTFSQSDRAIQAARLLLEGFQRSGERHINTFRPVTAVQEAQSQRNRICSETARQNRYDPGAGMARIDSPLLESRKITRQPVEISLGGVDAPASEAFLTAGLTPQGSVPVPAPRPDFIVLNIDGEQVPARIPPSGSTPVPLPRP